MSGVMRHGWRILATAVLGGCASAPEGLQPVIQNELLAKAKGWGFRTDDLIFVEQ